MFNAQQLSKWIPVSDELRSEIESCTVRFRMAATPYFLSLIDPDDPDDPIRKQCIVSSKELELCPGDMHDPLNEGGSSVTPHIVHRYPDRVLLLVTTQCAMYCRHCTRRRIVGERDCSPTIEELDKELDYIRAHKEVRDVLISGGDPLTLPTDRLEAIIKRLREIEHVDIIRIGTRVPCVLPMRIDDELVLFVPPTFLFSKALPAYLIGSSIERIILFDFCLRSSFLIQFRKVVLFSMRSPLIS